MDQNSYEVFDPRYQAIGYNTTAFDLLSKSGVFT
jgi:hypothetical protein